MSVVERAFSVASRNTATTAVVSGALVLSAAMGIRQTFGLFIGPFSFDGGLPVTVEVQLAQMDGAGDRLLENSSMDSGALVERKARERHVQRD